jgi:hypothetical protein
MEAEPQQPQAGDLRGRLAAIERAVDDGSYRPGPWHALVRDVRNSMFFERAALADDISRVSRKLHLRRPRRRVAMNTGILLEIAATIVGGLLMTLGVAAHSAALAFVGALLWMVTFEPLIKLIVGRAAGVHYDYFYLFGIEPRLKMRYGTYLARPRLLRIIVHLSGIVGSPLAAWLTSWMLSQAQPAAAALCYGAFWVLVIINVVNFILPLLGVNRIGPMPVLMSSAGSAAIEIREGLGR